MRNLVLFFSYSLRRWSLPIPTPCTPLGWRQQPLQDTLGSLHRNNNATNPLYHGAYLSSDVLLSSVLTFLLFLFIQSGLVHLPPCFPYPLTNPAMVWETTVSGRGHQVLSPQSHASTAIPATFLDILILDVVSSVQGEFSFALLNPIISHCFSQKPLHFLPSYQPPVFPSLTGLAWSVQSNTSLSWHWLQMCSLVLSHLLGNTQPLTVCSGCLVSTSCRPLGPLFYRVGHEPTDTS